MRCGAAVEVGTARLSMLTEPIRPIRCSGGPAALVIDLSPLDGAFFFFYRLVSVAWQRWRVGQDVAKAAAAVHGPTCLTGHQNRTAAPFPTTARPFLSHKSVPQR